MPHHHPQLASCACAIRRGRHAQPHCHARRSPCAALPPCSPVCHVWPHRQVRRSPILYAHRLPCVAAPPCSRSHCVAAVVASSHAWFTDLGISDQEERRGGLMWWSGGGLYCPLCFVGPLWEGVHARGLESIVGGCSCCLVEWSFSLEAEASTEPTTKDRRGKNQRRTKSDISVRFGSIRSLVFG